MYGKFLFAFGIAFMLFMVAIFVGNFLRSGFSSIFRLLISRFLMTFFISAVCFGLGLIVYSLYTGIPIIDAFNSIYAVFLDKIKEI